MQPDLSKSGSSKAIGTHLLGKNKKDVLEQLQTKTGLQAVIYAY